MVCGEFSAESFTFQLHGITTQLQLLIISVFFFVVVVLHSLDLMIYHAGVVSLTSLGSDNKFR